MFLSSLYSNLWYHVEKSEVLHLYAEFLIEQKQFTKAITVMSKISEKDLDIFGRCDHFRVQEKLTQCFSNNIYFDNYN